MCSHRRRDWTKVLSLQYAEDYWKLSAAVANSVHTANETRQFCRRRRCELGKPYPTHNIHRCLHNVTSHFTRLTSATTFYLRPQAAAITKTICNTCNTYRVCSLLICWQAASGRSRSPALQCGMIFHPMSHQHRHSRLSDSASSRFCSLSLIRTFTPDSQNLHLCGPSNNWHYLGHTKNYDDDDDDDVVRVTVMVMARLGCIMVEFRVGLGVRLGSRLLL